MRGRKHILAILIALTVLIQPVWVLPAAAQTDANFENVAVFVEFGKSITFQAVVKVDSAVIEAFLMLMPQGQDSQSIPIQVSETGEIVYVYDVNQFPLRSFAQTTYSYSLRLNNGRVINSPSYQFTYDDNRFPWLLLENDQFQIRWYDRDLAFGQQVADTTQKGLATVNSLLPIQPDRPVKIYIYNNPADIKLARGSNQVWVSGEASPDLGVILLSIPEGPEASLELERQLPHELMHILLYQLVGEKIENTPMWFEEGLASNAELYRNPEYELALLQSAKEDRLLPMQSLCRSFPKDASGAFLAYAQSASFISYLHRTYGSSAIRWMLEQYVNGLGCEEGIETALGKSLTQLEYQWKQDALELDPERLIINNLMPYLLLFGVVFGAAAVTIVAVSRRPRSAKGTDSGYDDEYEEA